MIEHEARNLVIDQLHRFAIQCDKMAAVLHTHSDLADFNEDEHKMIDAIIAVLRETHRIARGTSLVMADTTERQKTAESN